MHYNNFKHRVADLPRADQQRLFYSNAQQLFRCEPGVDARPEPEPARSEA
ncbi:hypothetical protein [Stenotrophomonas maltophilia]